MRRGPSRWGVTASIPRARRAAGRRMPCRGVACKADTGGFWNVEVAVRQAIPRGHLGVRGTVRVAFETLQPYDEDDPLHGLLAWVRLVIWTNQIGEQIPHVNVSSDLRKLSRAPLQVVKEPATGATSSLFLTDYETPRFEVNEGQNAWRGDIVPPRTFLDFLDRDERRRQTKERAGPRSPA